MTAVVEPSAPQHPFFSHLITVLSLYETPTLTPPPPYTGPTDELIQAIEAGVHALAKRAAVAEVNLAAALKNSGAFRSGQYLSPSSGGDEHTSKRVRRDGSSNGGPPATLDNISTPAPMQADEHGVIPGPGVLDRLSPMDSEDINPLGSVIYSNGTLVSNGSYADEDMGVDETIGYLSGLPHTTHLMCPSCGKTNVILSGYHSYDDSGVPISNESGITAVEELKLLKTQVQDVARVCRAVASGDLSQKVTVPVQGVVMVQLKDVINTMVEKLGQFAQEVTRVSLEVGTQGKLGGQAVVPDVEGTWQELTATVNKLAENLTIQVRSIAEVTMAVARGDLSREIVVEAQGEILELKTTVNNMVCCCSLYMTLCNPPASRAVLFATGADTKAYLN